MTQNRQLPPGRGKAMAGLSEHPVSSCPVNRLLRLLLLATLLGPSTGLLFPPVEETCAEEQGCGAGDECDVSCVQCGCCNARAITFASPSLVADLGSPPAPTTAFQVQAPPSAPPADILKVPKSV